MVHSAEDGSIPGSDVAASSEIIEGYMDGLRSDLPDKGPTNRADLYMHGWRNGRDDRMKTPRASADAIRSELADIKAKAQGEGG